MATIVNLVAKLTADTSQFKTQIGAVPSLLGKAKGAIAGFAGGLGLGAIVKASLDAGDALNDFKERTGLSVEFLSAMEQGSRLAGSSIDVFARAALKLQKNAELAAGGNKKLNEQFAALGINVEAFRALSPDEQIRAFAEGFAGLNTQGEKTLAITKLLGGNAAELAPIFKDGAAGLAELVTQAERSNRVLGTEQAEAAAMANDAIDLLSDSFSGLVRQLAINFAPAIAQVARGITALVEVVGPVIRGVVESFLQIGTTIGGIAALVSQLAQGNFRGAAELLRIERGDLNPTTGATRGGGENAAQKATAKNTATTNQKLDTIARALNRGVPAVAQ